MLTTRLSGLGDLAGTPTLASIQQVPVDLDERAFLFPAGKPLTRLVFHPTGRTIQVDAVFAFNASRAAPRLFTLELEDARVLARTIVDAVFLRERGLIVPMQFQEKHAELFSRRQRARKDILRHPMNGSHHLGANRIIDRAF